MRSLLFVLTLAATSCHSEPHTLLFLRLEAGPNAPADVQSIDVAFMLAGRSASVSLRESPARPIAFLTSDVIEIAAGAGTLDLVAIARNGSGHTGSKLRLFARKGSTTQPQYARINELEVY